MNNQFLISYMSQYESFLTKYRLCIKTLRFNVLLCLHYWIIHHKNCTQKKKNCFYEKFD